RLYHPVMSFIHRLSQAVGGATPSAFERRCLPAPPQRGCRVGGPGAPPQRGCRVGGPGSGGVAPPSNIPDIATPPRKTREAGAPVLGRRALPVGRLARLGTTLDFHHGLPGASRAAR